MAAWVIPLAGCSANPPVAVPASPRVTVEPSPRLPTVGRYVVAGDEPAPQVKRAAVRFVETLLNHGAGEGTTAAATTRLRRAGLSPRPAAQAGPLLSDAGAGAAEVVYPQLGGLTRASASVMAVVRQHMLRDRTVQTTTRTLDIRLAKGRDGWAVTRIASSGGDEARAARSPSPDPAGGLPDRVLSDDRIELADSARRDIIAGRADPRVLRLMLAIAARHTYSVTVVSTGHPFRVFGERSVSNHIRGRAIDIWKVDGRRVAAQRQAAKGPARSVAVQALAAGATEVGAPWSVSAAGRTTFTNTVHQDHLHIAFER